MSLTEPVMKDLQRCLKLQFASGEMPQPSNRSSVLKMIEMHQEKELLQN